MIGVVTTTDGKSCAEEMKKKGLITDIMYCIGDNINEIFRKTDGKKVIFFDGYIQENTVRKAVEMMEWNDYVLVHRGEGYLFPFAMRVVPNIVFDGNSLLSSGGPYLKLFNGVVLPPVYSR